MDTRAGGATQCAAQINCCMWTVWWQGWRRAGGVTQCAAQINCCWGLVWWQGWCRAGGATQCASQINCCGRCGGRDGAGQEGQPSVLPRSTAVDGVVAGMVPGRRGNPVCCPDQLLGTDEFGCGDCARREGWTSRSTAGKTARRTNKGPCMVGRWRGQATAAHYHRRGTDGPSGSIHSSEMVCRAHNQACSSQCVRRMQTPKGSYLDPEPFDPDKGGPFISTKFVTSWCCCEYYIRTCKANRRLL